MSLKADALMMIMGRGFGLVLGLVSWGLINRKLGPSARGQYAEIITWATLIMVVAGMSIDKIVHHFANREHYPISDTIKGIIVLSLSAILSIAGFTVFFVISLIHPEYIQLSGGIFILIIGMLVVAQIMSNSSLVFLRSVGDIKYCMFAMLSQSALQMILVLVGYKLDILTLKYCLFINVAVQLLALIFFAMALRKSGGVISMADLRNARPVILVKKMIYAGLRVHIATIATFIMLKLNQLMLVNMRGDAEAGFYAVSLQLVSAVMMVPMAIQSAMYPRVVHGKDDFYVTEKAMRFYVYGWSIITFILFMGAPWIISIYAGSEYASSAKPLKILLFAYWFMQLSALVSPYMIKKGAFWLYSLSGITLAMVSMFLNWVLIPIYGANGAAYATLISTAVIFTLSMIFIRVLSGKNMNILLLTKADISSIAQIIVSFYGQLRRRLPQSACL
jgi:O-antigen/teichoic acid export membrane protein